MKISGQILVTATTLFGLAAAAPVGYIKPFDLPECTETNGIETVAIHLPLNVCTQIAAFSSFEAGISTACAEGKTPMVTAYSGTECDGTSVNAATIPANGAIGVCNEISGDVGEGSVALSGQSAMFQCI